MLGSKFLISIFFGVIIKYEYLFGLGYFDCFVFGHLTVRLFLWDLFQQIRHYFQFLQKCIFWGVTAKNTWYLFE